VGRSGTVLGTAELLTSGLLSTVQCRGIDAENLGGFRLISGRSFHADVDGGLSAVGAENRVSIPIENALNSVPGQVELRSLADAGGRSVTVVFREKTDAYFARQLVLERLPGPASLSPRPKAVAPGSACHSAAAVQIWRLDGSPGCLRNE
jgi:hypothetical protein